MRRLRFISACLAILSVSCNERVLEPGLDSGGTGEVRISLSADPDHEIVGVRSTSEEEIPVDDFWVEIFTSDKKRIYCEKYADARDAVLNLNTGDYRLLAKHGDSLGVGFNHAFYMADETFTVEPRKGNSVSAVAKLSNVKAKVVFGGNITNTNFYGDCYALLKNSSSKIKPSLKFKKTEERAGYIPAGELILEVYAKIDGKLMYYPFVPRTFEPNDFVTYHVNAGVRKGDLSITIKVDNSVTVEEETVEIPANQAYPVIAPILTAKAFDADGSYKVIEGDSEADPDLEIGVVAEGVVETMVMDIDCDYMAGLGLPSRVDFMNLDSETEALLEEAGFVWVTNSAKTAAVVDFEEVATTIANNTPYDGVNDTNSSSFTLTVTDKEGKSNSETVSIIWEIGMKASVDAEDYDIWATRITNPTVTFTKGDPKESTLEYSIDGQTWHNLGGPLSIMGNKASYRTATGLEPGAPCMFRVVFKEKFRPRGEGSMITETAAQLGNSGFEEWTERTHNYVTEKLDLPWPLPDKPEQKHSREWYLPSGGSDHWWDVNSKKTMPDRTEREYLDCKVTPTVTYITIDGNLAAQLASTFVCNMATNANNGTGVLGGIGGIITGGVESAQAAGEMFIGTSDEFGNQAVKGHAFYSRPASLSFRYRYSSYGSDLFHVYMYVMDADDNIIASKDFKGGTVEPELESEWMNMTIPFEYTVFNKKAAKIYVCFRSSQQSDADVPMRTDKAISITIGDKSQKSWIGSVLTLDDLKLNY